MIGAEPLREVEMPASDYSIVSRLIEKISEDYRNQPSLEELSRQVDMEPQSLQRLFSRWAGLTPKGFLQAVTLNHAKRMLNDGAALLDAAYEVGMSGPGRLHDLFVTHEAMSPGDFKTRGSGLAITYGFHGSPFGRALVMATDRGLCGLAFADGNDDAALADMVRRWPNAHYVRNEAGTLKHARLVFDPKCWSADRPLHIVMIGTDFQLKVWRTLLKIPMGKTVRYGDIAGSIGLPKAARAVGAAVGANPISFVVPCHRAVGSSGALTGYHWGLTRKRAILGWETGHVAT